VQVVQFAPEQLDAASVVPRTTVFPTSKYCSLSAGQLSDLSSVAAGSVPAFSPTTMTLKIYNSADCNPATSERVIAVPFTANACNMYSAAASSRFFKIRCLSGEGFNGIHASTKYFFQDFSSLSACDGSSPAEPIASTSGVNATVALLSSGSCQALSGASSPQLYFRATCSNSNANPHQVTFYTDSACSSVAAGAAPGTAAGTVAALEYPCVKISDSASVSAGGFNDALYGIGSALLWTRSSTCQGLTNAVGNVNNFYPNDGECIRPDTFPPNELQAAGALPAGRSWRFFVNRNSQACKGGVTTASMIPNGKGNGGHIYGLCVNGFRDWGLSVFRFGDEHLCNSDN